MSEADLEVAPRRKLKKAVGEALAERGSEPPQGKPKKKKRTLKRRVRHAPAPPPKKDEALAFLEELEQSALGREWITGASPVLPATPLIAPPPVPEVIPDSKDIIAPMSRRQIMHFEVKGVGAPPMVRRVEFHTNFWAAFRRVFIWMAGLIDFVGGGLVDRLLRRHTRERSAVRLRKTFQKMGPTFVKLGQQLSLRADILPYEYTEELSKMLDKVPPFPVEQAIEVFEKTTGKRLGEVFAVFDPKPIGSASVACVFQAMLRTGERVAVKVRRPGIGPELAADLRVLSWLMSFAETMTFIRTGMTRHLKTELRSMLMEELDFRKEARYTYLFRARAEKKKQDYITAPKIYFEYSNEQVIVSDFMSGVLLWEVISAIDRNDQDALEQFKEIGIDPKVLAQHMFEAFNFETLESLLFHADPHPGNIIVQPGNRIVFIDFGSCGRFPSKTRTAWKQMHAALNDEDVQGMTRASISILEPLPHIDLASFTKEVEALFWDWLYAIKDVHSEWWEKASGTTWMRFIGIVRRYEVPMNLETLRLFRATFLYDTTAYRLHRQLNSDDEFQRYAKKAGRREMKKLKKAVRKRMRNGLTNADYMAVADLQRISRQVVTRIEAALNRPEHQFQQMLGKVGFIAAFLLQIAGIGLTIHIAVVGMLYVGALLTGQNIQVWDAFRSVVQTNAYQVGAALVGVILIRKILSRLRDVDVD